MEKTIIEYTDDFLEEYSSYQMKKVIAFCILTLLRYKRFGNFSFHKYGNALLSRLNFKTSFYAINMTVDDVEEFINKKRMMLSKFMTIRSTKDEEDEELYSYCKKLLEVSENSLENTFGKFFGVEPLNPTMVEGDMDLTCLHMENLIFNAVGPFEEVFLFQPSLLPDETKINEEVLRHYEKEGFEQWDSLSLAFVKGDVIHEVWFEIIDGFITFTVKVI